MTASLARAARRTRFTLRSLFTDRVGANLVEYIMLVGLVALGSIGAYTLFGDNVVNKIKAQGAKVLTIKE
jgi:Flp pilus assembly pilin Flp